MDQQRYNLLMEKTAAKFSPVTIGKGVRASAPATGMISMDDLVELAAKGPKATDTQVLRQRLSAKPLPPAPPQPANAERLVDQVNRDDSTTPGVRSRVVQLLQAIGDNPGRSAAIGGGAAALGLGAAALARRGRGGLSRNAKLGIGAGVAGGAGLAGLLASRD